jgi:hypothetical protein
VSGVKTGTIVNHKFEDEDETDANNPKQLNGPTKIPKEPRRNEYRRLDERVPIMKKLVPLPPCLSSLETLISSLPEPVRCGQNDGNHDARKQSLVNEPYSLIPLHHGPTHHNVLSFPKIPIRTNNYLPSQSLLSLSLKSEKDLLSKTVRLYHSLSKCDNQTDSRLTRQVDDVNQDKLSSSNTLTDESSSCHSYSSSASPIPINLPPKSLPEDHSHPLPKVESIKAKQSSTSSICLSGMSNLPLSERVGNVLFDGNSSAEHAHSKHKNVAATYDRVDSFELVSTVSGSRLMPQGLYKKANGLTSVLSTRWESLSQVPAPETTYSFDELTAHSMPTCTRRGLRLTVEKAEPRVIPVSNSLDKTSVCGRSQGQASSIDAETIASPVPQNVSVENSKPLEDPEELCFKEDSGRHLTSMRSASKSRQTLSREETKRGFRSSLVTEEARKKLDNMNEDEFNQLLGVHAFELGWAYCW